MQSTQNPVTGLVTPARTLRAAAGYLERHGWIQGAYYDLSATGFTPAACMVGALAIVCYGGPVDCPAHLFDEPGFDEFEAALTVLEGHLCDVADWYDRFDGEPYPTNAYDFNDAKGIEADDVIVMLQMAACVWEKAQPDTVARLHRVLREASNVRLISGGAA